MARCRAVRPRLSVRFTLIIFLLVPKMMIMVTMTLMVRMDMKMAMMVFVHNEDFDYDEIKLL